MKYCDPSGHTASLLELSVGMAIGGILAAATYDWFWSLMGWNKNSPEYYIGGAAAIALGMLGGYLLASVFWVCVAYIMTHIWAEILCCVISFVASGVLGGMAMSAEDMNLPFSAGVFELCSIAANLLGWYLLGDIANKAWNSLSDWWKNRGNNGAVGNGGTTGTGSPNGDDYDSKTPRTGEEWREYFEDKYGANNVTWKPNSVDDIKNDPTRLVGLDADDVSSILGDGWRPDTYGSAGDGWKFIKESNPDNMVFYHPEGGVHGGAYYGFSSGPTGTIKVVNPETYIPTPDDKATIIYYTGW